MPRCRRRDFSGAVRCARLVCRPPATELPPANASGSRRSEAILAGVALVALLMLLGGVATGYFYAVEAAAMGAFTLLCAGLISGQLRGGVLRELLHDAIAITGALFSLLIAATTFTLILRLLGTDRLVNNLVAGIPGGDMSGDGGRARRDRTVRLRARRLRDHLRDGADRDSAAADARRRRALGGGAGAADVAVEFPAAAVRLCADDGARRAKNPAPFRPFVRALVPFLMAQWMLLIVVLLVPKLVHIGENAAESSRAPAAPVSSEEIDRRMREMLPPPPERADMTPA